MRAHVRAKLALQMFLMFCLTISWLPPRNRMTIRLVGYLSQTAKTGLLQLIDLDNGEVIETFLLEGPASVYTVRSCRIAGIAQSRSNRVDFIRSGLCNVIGQ